MIIAYACEPNETSEPGVGWNFSKEISRHYDTLVLTRKNNQQAIESGAGNASEFIYYDLPETLMALKKKTPLGTQWYYGLWQWGAYRYAKKFMVEVPHSILLVHHLNFAMTWLAPPAFLINKPFVWGPVGGGDHIPLRFFGDLSAESKFQEGFYALLNQVGRFSPFSYWARKKADAILFRTESTMDNFPISSGKTVTLMSETASVLSDFRTKTWQQETKAICVGRLAYWKGFLYAVKGFHGFLENGGTGTLEIFGEGPEKDAIAAYIQRHGLFENIMLKGFVDNATIKRKMEQASVLLHPSFRDGGSWSIMEAMSLGLPVICLNTSGPKDMVGENGGVLIRLGSSDQIVEDIASALSSLQINPVLYERLSAHASQRMEKEYNWKRRGEQIQSVYDQVLHNIDKGAIAPK